MSEVMAGAEVAGAAAKTGSSKLLVGCLVGGTALAVAGTVVVGGGLWFGAKWVKEKAEDKVAEEGLRKLGKVAEEYPVENIRLIEKHKVDIEKHKMALFDEMFLTGLPGAFGKKKGK